MSEEITPPENEKYVEPNVTNSQFSIRLPLLLSLAFAIGLLLGATVFSDKLPSFNNTISKNAGKFRDIISYIDRYYVDSTNIDELTETGIEAMIAKLDPHTAYVPAKDSELVNSSLEGEFVGVGIEYNVFNDTVNVVNTISGGPSDKAGILGGDKIVMVNDDTIAGIKITNREVVDRLRGKEGTKVEIAVKREGIKKLLTFTVERDKITTSSVDIAYMLNQEVGYLKVNRFGAKTYDEFADSLKKLNGLGMKKLILDLRDNGGGYLDKAIKIADAFLKKGKLIVYTEGKEPSFDERAEATSTGEFENGDLVVLINEYSASASEIVSGALQDNDRATIVGRRSYGKGLVQRPIPLSDGSNLRLTISRYYTPSGRSIQKPYDENLDYGGDITERYNNGEMFSADSIQFDESLKYKTTSGRTVYGGGGITPDYFVPIDTSYYNDFYKAIIAKNLLRSFALRYATRNKSELESGGLERFKTRFEFTGNVEKQFLENLKEVGIGLNKLEYAQSKSQIASEIKSFIARNIWQDAGFFPVLHQSDKTLLKAMELIEKK